MIQEPKLLRLVYMGNANQAKKLCQHVNSTAQVTAQVTGYVTLTRHHDR